MFWVLCSNKLHSKPSVKQKWQSQEKWFNYVKIWLIPSCWLSQDLWIISINHFKNSSSATAYNNANVTIKKSFTLKLFFSSANRIHHLRLLRRFDFGCQLCSSSTSSNKKTSSKKNRRRRGIESERFHLHPFFCSSTSLNVLRNEFGIFFISLLAFERDETLLHRTFPGSAPRRFLKFSFFTFIRFFKRERN